MKDAFMLSKKPKKLDTIKGSTFVYIGFSKILSGAFFGRTVYPKI